MMEGMGRRKFHSGDEYDAYGRYRHLIGWGRGALASIKRATHKRERAAGKRSTWRDVE